jgi:pilus assembly protein Flp/PilA
MEQIKQFFNDESGITFAETGLYIAIVTLVAAVGLGLIGTNLNTLFDNIGKRMVAP